MPKKTVNITLDEHIWDLAKDVLGNRSAWIEKQLRIALNEEDDEAQIMKKIQKKENEVNVLKDKLCKLREKKAKQLQVDGIFDKSMVSINRIHSKLGFVGKNQIRKIAKVNDVPSRELIDFCLEQGLNLVEFYEVPK